MIINSFLIVLPQDDATFRLQDNDTDYLLKQKIFLMIDKGGDQIAVTALAMTGNANPVIGLYTVFHAECRSDLGPEPAAIQFIHKRVFNYRATGNNFLYDHRPIAELISNRKFSSIR